MDKPLPTKEIRRDVRQYILEVLDEIALMAERIGDPLLSSEIKVAADMGRAHDPERPRQ
jgi:hypothetical protein